MLTSTVQACCSRCMEMHIWNATTVLNLMAIYPTVETFHTQKLNMSQKSKRYYYSSIEHHKCQYKKMTTNPVVEICQSRPKWWIDWLTNLLKHLNRQTFYKPIRNVPHLSWNIIMWFIMQLEASYWIICCWAPSRKIHTHVESPWTFTVTMTTNWSTQS